MKRKKIVILPKLNDAGGNLSKKWFVYYSVRDPRTDKMERFKDHVGLSHPDESVRRERADKIIQELTVKLKKGWTPFLDDTEAIYEDQLQYKHVADIYGTQKAANATFRMFASQYIEEKKKEKLEEKTIQTYVSKLRMLTVWSEANKGQIDITAFDNALILEFFNYLVNKKKLATGEGLKIQYNTKKSVIYLIIAISTIVFTIWTLFCGSIQIRCNDRDFNIEAKGWNDYTGEYSQIDSISYEENVLQNDNDYRTNVLET